jgi:hypothetical protein
VKIKNYFWDEFVLSATPQATYLSLAALALGIRRVVLGDFQT